VAEPSVLNRMRASGQTKHRGVEHGTKRSQLLTGSWS